MLLVVSPAKSLDYVSPVPSETFSMPVHLDRSCVLIEILRGKSTAEIASMMHISDSLAALNSARYEAWGLPFALENARQAAFAFDGDVYDGLAARTMNAPQIACMQRRLRILSGLYGVLRPLDLIQPYRLEMGTRLAVAGAKNLYGFWGNTITQTLNLALAEAGDGEEPATLVNLASEEYFKAVKPACLAGRVITPVFQECVGGSNRIVGFFAKRARGLMARYAIANGLTKSDQLKEFSVGGYTFCEEVSNNDIWIFRRERQ